MIVNRKDVNHELLDDCRYDRMIVIIVVMNLLILKCDKHHLNHLLLDYCRYYHMKLRKTHFNTNLLLDDRT